MAESVSEKSLRIRHLAPLATATARSIGDFDLAKHYCELRLASDPDDVIALYGMADCLVQQGNIDEAKPYVAKCYELGSARGDAVGQGVIELLQKRFPQLRLGS
jgi:tetratricopeptide (TPR) repeat protein